MGFFLKGNKDLFGLLEFLADAKMRARGEKERERKRTSGEEHILPTDRGIII